MFWITWRLKNIFPLWIRAICPIASGGITEPLSQILKLSLKNETYINLFLATTNNEFSGGFSFFAGFAPECPSTSGATR
ncbi:9065_t:CDS:2, partial [Cetraspora pellucida]